MDSVGLFIDSKLPGALKKEEIYNYFGKMKLGDMTARDEIIIHNIKLVIHEVLTKFSTTPYDLEELVSIGLIGLIKSVDTFDTSKEFAFTSYATRCIDNEILTFIKKGKKYISDVSLDQPIRTDREGREWKIEDVLCDMNTDFVSEYEDNELYKLIRKFIEKLPEREKNIVMKYFGFIDKPMTQTQIANELGLTQAFISKVIIKVLNDVKLDLETLGIIEGSRKDKHIKIKK